ncbi:MAG TPA: response regulator [Desulfocapsa sulfexigens]|nr:response regulator [Desulfocapsa sulfexigens]
MPPHPDTPEQGFKLLEDISILSPHVRVIVITGNAEEENAIQSIALGAIDFCEKPIDLKLLKIILSRTFKFSELAEAKRQLQKQSTQTGSLAGMLGVSAAMNKVFDRLRHASKTDYPILITGKTGTGKDLAAHAVHSLSQRATQNFIIVNCGAIPENLLESELFGHEKGAFTGAVSRQIGKFEQAGQGTLFLDEIGELPLLLQVKLLRVLQESTIQRLGGTKTISLDVRVIAATNANLEESVKNGTFRKDLFYRLNVVPLRLPDLSERPEDILLLAHHFLQEESQKLKRGKISFLPTALTALSTYDWPGNVRELQNRIRRALGTTLGNSITAVDLELEEIPQEQQEQKLPTLKEAREKAEKNVVYRALALTANNISQAAKLLGVSRPTLHDLLKKHKITIQK